MFVTYHGCGTCYIDGTNALEGTRRKCFAPIYNPSWKEPCNTSNRIANSTRSQLKKNSIATRSYCKKYFQYCRRYKKSYNNNIFNHWTDSSEDEYSSSDDESNNSNYTDK